ncbi:flagellar assembly protein FliH [Ferrimonas sediminicola]|uniref:Flagellar assembly protein FliH n=1 Tax=Ferrimonas sediminicola TaxID=2569538 RepID=A0A4U1BB49_9GAMM|nr:flagellar assembly protein FliH [Ferrimonas sediminicola]TKB47240.1 flagellar assembly protein FliH [Ferrimonas sediminicola]
MSQETRAQFNRRLASQLDGDEAQQWQLPDVGEGLSQPSPLALNISSGEPEPPAQEEETPAPPTLAEIESIREDARQEGFDEGLTEGTRKGLEEGRLKGLEEGHSQGYEQGLEQGLEEGRARIQAQLAQLDSLLNQLVEPLQAIDNQVEQELVELSQHLARAVIGCEVKTQSEPLLLALRQAIDALPSREQRVTIQLSGEDMQLVRDSYGDDELARRNWHLELEPSLSRGSLKVLTQRSEVAMPLAERIDTIFSQFINQPRPAVDEPDYPRFHSAPDQEAGQGESDGMTSQTATADTDAPNAAAAQEAPGHGAA